MSGCPQLGPDGKCQGLYLGFACIRDKCLMQDKEAACPHCIGGDYCTKYNRFGCIGPENCATENDYLAHIRQARDKHWASKAPFLSGAPLPPARPAPLTPAGQ